ncbi:adenylate/guanylate cyclase domain-containing protein [Porticoccaceae bacterium]|nr:adenylate/guanylate cyclase domain-containing protein [Porticoccaceae bacterium]MDA8936367.1 adenylate/guanylate cyclase domain-containing protein [Porticoccaceae bacterium]
MLGLCGAIILLGAWGVIGYHPALLVLLPALFVYQFSCYFRSMASPNKQVRQRLTLLLEFVDGVLAGVLLAFVGFDPLLTIALGLGFLMTVISPLKATAPLELFGLFAGALLTYWLLPISVSPGLQAQLLILLLVAGYCLLLANMARNTHSMLAEQNDSVLRQNEWLKLRTFRLSKYLSPPLHKAILTGKDVRAETQEKALTIFFSDMEGFTQLVERLDPEQLTSLLNSYLTVMSEIAFRFGGTVDKVIGDSIMVFFGDPESRGVRSDAVRCVSMAIAMRKAMHELQLRLQAEGIEHPVGLRMGINSGVCKVGNFGTENRLDYTLLGRAVNLASRLESSADSNEILLSEDTCGLIGDSIHCIDKGQISIKGFAEPVKVYSAVDLHKHLSSDYPPRDSATVKPSNHPAVADYS